MPRSSDIPEKQALAVLLDSIGGELLTGSGFEGEQPDVDFSLSGDVEE